MSRLTLLLIAVPLSFAFLAYTVDGKPKAAAGQRPAQTWAARSSSGVTWGGAWTAMEDAKTGAVTGAWTVIDAKNQVVMQGGWSATKAASGWTGNWRTTAVGRPGENSGTWMASVDLKPNARFSDLFAKAAENAVSGMWGAEGQSGSWTIQVFN